ncbi:MAG: hypothetical protein HRT53_09565 [Colwellia sp.]|nr:hypothetical protein [Colwellia sp.]
MKNNQLILIIYYGRSGSVFMHNLLDGHPQVISMPPVLMSFVIDLNEYQPDLSNANKAYSYFIEIYGKLSNSNNNFSRQNLVKTLQHVRVRNTMMLFG